MSERTDDTAGPALVPERSGVTRVALVTGAAQGLGRVFSVALARRGYRVAGLDIADQSATAAEAPGFLPVTADVTDPDAVERAVAAVVAHFGGLHIVVNNAGMYPPIPFAKTTLTDWRNIMRLNLEGPFLVTQAA